MPSSKKSETTTVLTIQSRSATCCDAGLVELRNALLREHIEEAHASERYRDTQIKLTHFNLPTASGKVKKISQDEFTHYYLLEEVIKEINQKCQCLRITRPSDADFKPGQLVSREEFDTMARMIKEQGGEIPLAEEVK